MYDCFACVCVHARARMRPSVHLSICLSSMCIQCMQNPEGIGCFEIGVTDSCQQPVLLGMESGSHGIATSAINHWDIFSALGAEVLILLKILFWEENTRATCQEVLKRLILGKHDPRKDWTKAIKIILKRTNIKSYAKCLRHKVALAYSEGSVSSGVFWDHYIHVSREPGYCLSLWRSLTFIHIG